MTDPDPDPGASGPPEPRPRPVTATDQAAFDVLVREALPTVRSMVVAWRTGLTGLVTLVTTGVVLTGRTTVTGLAAHWRAAVTVTVGGGLGLAIMGLWHILAAEAGTRTRLQSLQDILAHHGSVAAWKVALAATAARRLNTARTLVAAALTLLGTSVLLTWWAPPAPTDPPAYLKVTRRAGVVCGALASADEGVLRLTVGGTQDPVAIPLVGVTNLAVTSGCP